MKTKTVNLYQLHELSDEVKKKVIDRLSNINVQYGWWENVYEHFIQFAELIGFNVDIKKTCFVGFYHQGEGSAFTARIDVAKMITCVKDQSWKKHYTDFCFRFKDNGVAIIRIEKLMKARFIDFHSRVTAGQQSNVIYTEHNTRILSEGRCTNALNVGRAIVATEDLVTQMADKLNMYLFKSLRSEYEFLTSSGMVIDTILANDYYFTDQGKLDGD